MEGLVAFPSLRTADRDWLYEEYNGCMLKKKTFMKLVKQAWKGPGQVDYDHLGENFLFILLRQRATPRYFINLTHELHARKAKLPLGLE